MSQSEIKWSAHTIKTRDGRIYEVDVNGTRRRVSPEKPWRNKAEHKRHKKQRRIERLEAA